MEFPSISRWTFSPNRPLPFPEIDPLLPLGSYPISFNHQDKASIRAVPSTQTDNWFKGSKTEAESSHLSLVPGANLTDTVCSGQVFVKAAVVKIYGPMGNERW